MTAAEIARADAALVFIRLRDILDEMLAAGIVASETFGHALNEARRAYDELTHPKPVIGEPVILVQHGERLPYAPAAGRRLAPEPPRAGARS